MPASPAAPARPAARGPRRRRAALRGAVGVVVFGGVVAGGAAGVAAWLDHLDTEPLVQRCSAVLEGTAWHLETDQADTAALLAGTSLRRGLPARATTIALATGLQESKLRNIDHGDRDSLGIFQQRPSQGWGTPEQVTDPVYATNAFYDALVEVAGYEELPITEAAQAVQRSGFPDAYAQHETRSRAWANALYGYTPGALTCTLGEAEGTGDPGAIAARVARDLGELPTTPDATGVLVDASPMSGGGEDTDRLAWAVAHWAVSVAGTLHLEEVRVADQVWQRAEGGWTPGTGEALAPGQVRLVPAAG